LETYFDLQEIIAIETLIVHLMVGVISISATLILYKGKPTCDVNGGCVVVTSRMSWNKILTVDWPHFLELGYHIVQDGHIFYG
jgi:hypothetical protein